MAERTRSICAPASGSAPTLIDTDDTSAAPWIVDFADGSREMRDLLGGKGANVAEMTRVLGAERVPGGFTITTEACVAYMAGDGRFPRWAASSRSQQALERLEALARQAPGRRGGPAARVGSLGRARVDAGDARHGPQPGPQRRDRGRPGAALGQRALRLGLLPALRADVRQRRRRASPASASSRRSRRAKAARGVSLDTELDADALRELTREFQRFYDFPADPREQLARAIRAVFDSWQGERAIAYRRINRIPDEWGTAVNVQQMVFGNLGESSGSGVAFSRDELTGAPRALGGLPAKRAGRGRRLRACARRATSGELRAWLPEVHEQLMEILRTLERHYGDMQDTEFTVQEGRLYMLQTRNAKRPAQAAVRFAVDAVAEGLLDREAALADDRPLVARRAAAPDVRPERRLRGAGDGRRRLSRRGQGRDRAERAPRPCRRPRRAAR